MKNLRRLFLLTVCTFAWGITLTSCLGDDDSEATVVKTLTEQEKAAQLTTMRGAYDGYIHFINDTTAKEDSIQTGWSLTDSTLKVKVPVKLFANGVNSNAVRQLLMPSEDAVDVVGYIYPYYNNYNDNPERYTFSYIPLNNKVTFTVTQDDKAHEVTATFSAQYSTYFGTFYSLGQYLNRTFMSYLLLYSVSVDGATYTCSSPMYVIGNKI